MSSHTVVLFPAGLFCVRLMKQVVPRSTNGTSYTTFVYLLSLIGLMPSDEKEIHIERVIKSHMA